MGREDFVAQLLQPLTDRPAGKNPAPLTANRTREIDAHAPSPEDGRHANRGDHLSHSSPIPGGAPWSPEGPRQHFFSVEEPEASHAPANPRYSGPATA